jgi:cell division protein FtsL
MIKRSTIIFAVIASFAGWGLFQVKYRVLTLERQYKQARKNITETHESIHILKAEWSHLTNPERLKVLAQHHLHMHPIQASQLISWEKVPSAKEPPKKATEENAYDHSGLDALISEVSIQSTPISFKQ